MNNISKYQVAIQRYRSAGFFLLSLMLLGGGIGCGDTIAPLSSNDTTGQSARSNYAFLLGENSRTGDYLYQSYRDDGIAETDYGVKISHTPTGSGKTLMSSADGLLYVVDLQTGEPLSEGFTPTYEDSYVGFDVFTTAISPDGNRLAWVETHVSEEKEKRRLIMVDADGGNRVTQWFDAAEGTFMRFSPDGNFLAFFYTHPGTGNTGLYKVSRDGKEVTLLASVKHPVSNGLALMDWSPDGSRIVFSDGTSFSTLYVVNADGTGLRPLATGYLPDWSPDGSTILFTAAGLLPGLAMISSEGGEVDILTPSAAGMYGRWSPDGQHILYAEYDEISNFDDPYPQTRTPARIRVMEYATRSVVTLSSEGERFGLYWVE